MVHLSRGGAAEHQTSIEEDERLASLTIYLMAHYPSSVEKSSNIYIIPSRIWGRQAERGDLIEILLSAEKVYRLFARHESPNKGVPFEHTLFD